MIITYHGDNYFKLQAGQLTVLIDPTNQRSFKGASLIINTLKPAATPLPADENVVWIDHQGEFEVKGIQVRGWSAGYEKEKKKTIYRLLMDELVVVILSSLTKSFSENLKDYFTGADIVLGSATKDMKPALVIPAFKGKELEALLKEFGQKEGETMEKLVIKKKDIPVGKAKVICLKS